MDIDHRNISESSAHQPELHCCRIPIQPECGSSNGTRDVRTFLLNYAEPLSATFSFHNLRDYPSSFLDLAWKWLLKNNPHDFICGCSIDQTYEEMKPRFSWSESIAQQVIDDNLELLKVGGEGTGSRYVYAFNHSNSNLPQLITLSMPSSIPVVGLQSEVGEKFYVQPTDSSEHIVLDERMSPAMIRTGIRMLPGRRLMDYYINDVAFFDGIDPGVCEIRLVCGDTLEGDLEIEDLKQSAYNLIDSKKYSKFHILATKGVEQVYTALIPLKPWGWTGFGVLESMDQPAGHEFEITKNQVRTRNFDLSFNKDGSFQLFDKTTRTQFQKLHAFEDTGDRGDLYTFGKVEPTVYSTSKIRRKIISKGPIFYEIEQELELLTFKELGPKRDSRVGKAKIPLRRYSDSIPTYQGSTSRLP